MKNFASERALKFTESVIRDMTRVCLKHQGVNLAQGFPDFPAPPEIKEAAIQAISSDFNQYAITWGTPSLRQAIADKFAWYNGVSFDPEKEITVCCGSTEAMIASLMAIVNPGEEVIVFEPFYENYGPDAILSAFDQIIEKTESRLRAAVLTIPDGVYRFSDVMDDDGLAARDIPIVLAIHKTGDKMVFDFEGTSRQVPGNINMTLNGTVAAVSFALKALLDPEIPNNEGVLRVVDVRAEKGLIVNAEFPAATAARLHTCQRVADVVFGALASALPERVVAGGNGANTTAIFSGVDPRSGEPYVYLETLGGGAGGRCARDGKDGVQVNLTNTSNLPVEAIELEYPLMVEGYGLVPDTGGAGRQRGGLALCRIIRPVGHTCIFNGAGERFTNRPWGLFGGEPGATGSFKLIRQDGSSERLSNKPSGLSVGPGETVVVQTPGAGGYGPANERPVSELQRDLESEKYSTAFVKEHYPHL